MNKSEYRSRWKENKAEYLQENFGRIAPKYDLFNDLTTFYLHRLWKKDIIKTARRFLQGEAAGVNRAVDLCCGSGDITLLLARSFEASQVYGLDFAAGMLEVAGKRVADRPAEAGRSEISLHQADVTDLSMFKDNSVDLVTMGFGLRNVVNREACLAEVYRILKPGGVFINLDLGKVNAVVSLPAKMYFYYVVPLVGKVIFRDNREMFAYLPNSNDTYYSQAELSAVLEKTGFTLCLNRNYLLGQTTMHAARK